MADDTAQLLLFGVVIVILTPLLGRYMARVYAGERNYLTPVVAPIEKIIWQICAIDSRAEQHWSRYAFSVLAVNIVCVLIFYAILRLQYYLPLNPRSVMGLEPSASFATAVSFITGTNWQAYAGEADLSFFSQMVGCTAQNFLAAATAMSVGIAVMRGLTQSRAKTLGNFHVDFIRTILYILLPGSFIFALIFVFQGVPQTLSNFSTVVTVEGGEQVLAHGPVASQVAVKMFSTSGGGFFNANGAHPFSNPTPLTNFLQAVLILAIPAALTYTFGTMAGDVRQGWALFSAMAFLFVIGLAVVYAAEGGGNTLLNRLPIDQTTGNMEGKETRFGTAGSALWAVTATATATGAVNSMLESYTPMGGMVPLLNVQLNEAIFGGVGSGFYSLLFYIVLATFIAGLMVGRSPVYLGKKIEVREIKLAVLTPLIVPIGMLLLPALALQISEAASAMYNKGPHGLTEILVAYASAVATNGASFAGFDASQPFHLNAQALAMMVGRFSFIIAALAIAGSLGAKRSVTTTVGGVPTHTPLFVILMISIIFIFGAMSFFPALALGPLAEHFEMLAGQTF
ncbi:MAG: potassium-transporting ATPase subunit KdpA [Hyphomicrobiales bacterium]|nr:potassium-transporting ATPase subunit KdpA [Hyphomicrobiales bacterium]